MSNIPEARLALDSALQYLKFERLDVPLAVARIACAKIHYALSLMDREPYVRRAKAKRIKIDKKTKAKINRLARDPNLTMQEIASLTGVRSAGRVSEVLNGLR